MQSYMSELGNNDPENLATTRPVVGPSSLYGNYHASKANLE